MTELIKIFNLLKVSRTNLIISCSLLLVFLLSFNTLLKPNVLENPSLDLTNFPKEFGSWKGMDSEGLDIRSLDILRLSTYVRRQYTNDRGQSVFLYIGYWASQSGEYQAAKHSPALCLPSNGWQATFLNDTHFNLKDDQNQPPITIRKLIGEKRNVRELFYYWFFAGDKYYSQEWYALISLTISNLLYGRNDGGIVEVSTGLGGTIQTEEAQKNSEIIIEEFLGELVPYFHSQIKLGHLSSQKNANSK